MPPESLAAKIHAYIKEIALPTLLSEEVSFLEDDFLIDEVNQTVKDFPLG